MVVLCTAGVHAEECREPGSSWPDDWTRPYPPHRMFDNLYAVGNAGLSVYLITTPDGHILVNTGLADSRAMIERNVAELGFELADVRVLLTTQAHFDHTAALAEIKQLTGAEMWATAKDARVLADGGASDAHFGHCTDFHFEPIEVDRILSDGEVIEFGGMAITVHLHPGHTEGSSSYAWTATEAGRELEVAIINMATVNDGKKLLLDPTYPGVAEDFANTFARQKAMNPDVWVSSHGSQYLRESKHQPGQAYSPEAFVDPAGFHREVKKLQQAFLDYLAAELE